MTQATDGTAGRIQQVADALSSERLAPYQQQSGGELTAAIGLYEWNLQVRPFVASTALTTQDRGDPRMGCTRAVD